jgi:TM2 domain-containing membrane protein YozV
VSKDRNYKARIVNKIEEFYNNHPFWFLTIVILLLPVLIPVVLLVILGYYVMSTILEALGIDE